MQLKKVQIYQFKKQLHVLTNILLWYLIKKKVRMTSYLMKLDCQNGKPKSRVCPGPSGLLHKIIGKNNVEKKMKKDANKEKGANKKKTQK